VKPVVVTDPPRTDEALVAALGEYGVATLGEAMGRTGYLGPHLRPIYPGARLAGTAVPVVCWPGDNLMIHVAIEQTRPGDVLVVTTSSPSRDGFFGELFATALAARGVVGLVTETGVRDTAELTEMRFPVWAPAVSAQGTVKATAGSVNLPVTIGGVVIEPGDVIVADDDGVVCVPRAHAGEVSVAAGEREAKEARNRERFKAGELGLDVYGLRPLLERLGVEYRPYETP
jgi:4-hydroxy-4-methyl-2-oxoglutarate aldolase